MLRKLLGEGGGLSATGKAFNDVHTTKRRLGLGICSCGTFCDFKKRWEKEQEDLVEHAEHLGRNIQNVIIQFEPAKGRRVVNGLCVRHRRFWRDSRRSRAMKFGVCYAE